MSRGGAQAARAILADAASLYISGCAAEIAEAPALLAQCRRPGAIVTGNFTPLVNHGSYADSAPGLRVRTFFLTKALKADIDRGRVDYCPWRYSVIDRWLQAPGRFDTALVAVAPPDADGRCSLGVQSDFFPSFLDRVERVVGVINPNMPATAGHASVRYADLAATLDSGSPLPEMPARPADAVSIAIAGRIVALVRDGATVQVGVGQIPSQVLGRLNNHRGLRIHSGVIDDNILALESAGALDRDYPIVTGTAVGTIDLYDAVRDRQRFSFRPVAHTHAMTTLVDLPHFTAVNSALRVDLFGQVAAEGAGGRLLASPGGLPDFVRGALANYGGTSIVAVRAGSNGKNPGGIVATIDNPAIVTNGAVDADIVVTEFGVAHLRGLSLDARAEAMIAIAAPEDQAALQEAWSSLRHRWFATSRATG